MTEPIARIEAALKRLGAEHEPPVGWEARVLAATQPARRRPWWWFAAPAVLAAAALVFFLVPRTHRPLALGLDIEVVSEPGRTTVRGNELPQLGDKIRASATGAGPHRKIWIYRNELELVLACPGPPGCEHTADATIADFKLSAIGSYNVVAVSSSAPVPAPTGRYDADVAMAKEAGLQIVQRKFEVL